MRRAALIWAVSRDHRAVDVEKLTAHPGATATEDCRADVAPPDRLMLSTPRGTSADATGPADLPARPGRRPRHRRGRKDPARPMAQKRDGKAAANGHAPPMASSTRPRICSRKLPLPAMRKIVAATWGVIVTSPL